MNIHRWRKLAGSDPSTYELITKIQTLQKRLIAKTEEVVEKELVISQKEKLYRDVKEVLQRQPGPEILEELRVVKEAVKIKIRECKSLASELNMYHTQVNEYKYELDKLNREYQSLKKKYYERKRRDRENKAAAALAQVAVATANSNQYMKKTPAALRHAHKKQSKIGASIQYKSGVGDPSNGQSYSNYQDSTVSSSIGAAATPTPSMLGYQPIRTSTSALLRANPDVIKRLTKVEESDNQNRVNVKVKSATSFTTKGNDNNINGNEVNDHTKGLESNAHTDILTAVVVQAGDEAEKAIAAIQAAVGQEGQIILDSSVATSASVNDQQVPNSDGGDEDYPHKNEKMNNSISDTGDGLVLPPLPNLRSL